MKKTIFLYGLTMAFLAWFLKYIDYRFLIRDISMEVYVGIIASLFTVIGIWMGLRLTRPKVIVQEITEIPSEEFTVNEANLKTSGISPREYEVLKLMAQGLSYKEIADQLFISLNTVKSHSSNLFSKLDAKRRTQAIQRGKELGLIG